MGDFSPAMLYGGVFPSSLLIYNAVRFLSFQLEIAITLKTEQRTGIESPDANVHGSGVVDPPEAGKSYMGFRLRPKTSA